MKSQLTVDSVSGVCVIHRIHIVSMSTWEQF